DRSASPEASGRDCSRGAESATVKRNARAARFLGHRPSPRSMLLAFVVSSFASFSPAAQRDHAGAITESRAQVAELLGRERIPGCVVAVAIADDIVWQEAFGVTDLDAKSAVTPETRYRIGSLTKLLTIAALL